MQVITDLNQVTKLLPPLALTMGDFDGIHRGHRALLERTTEEAQKLALTPSLLTFDPSPKKILDKLAPDNYILTIMEKQFILERSGIKLAIFIPFTLAMAQMSARRYLREILLGKLNMKKLIIGYDHHFGRNRRGNFRYLSMAASRYAFTVEQVAPVKSNGRIISSSAIRKALDAGDIAEANAMLALPYFITGPVLPGMKRGKQLGFPTANLQPAAEKKIPRAGVYFGAAAFGGKLHRAVINIGHNPTFNNSSLTVEAHLPGFSGDLYGKQITLIFLQRLRDEMKFPGPEALRQQITVDISRSAELTLPPELSFFV